jgi:hypothetical protein
VVFCALRSMPLVNESLDFGTALASPGHALANRGRLPRAENCRAQTGLQLTCRALKPQAVSTLCRLGRIRVTSVLLRPPRPTSTIRSSHNVISRVPLQRLAH